MLDSIRWRYSDEVSVVGVEGVREELTDMTFEEESG